MAGMVAITPFLPRNLSDNSRITVWKYWGSNYSGPNGKMYPELFDLQLRYLTERGYQTLNYDEVLSFLSGQIFPVKATILAFETGLDQVEVIETLERYQLKAVSFKSLPNDLRLVKLSANTTSAAIRLFGKRSSVLMPVLGNQRTAIKTFGTHQGFNETPVLLSILGNPPQIWLTESKLLPSTCISERLMQPRYIVIHTDGNTSKPELWLAEKTWQYLSGQRFGIHFIADANKVWQTTSIYSGNPAWWPMLPQGGAKGINHEAISIEMAGSGYGGIVTGTISEVTKTAIEQTTQKTIDLVVQIMNRSGIPYERVVGHFELSIEGKTDPGQKYLNEYFRPRLRQVLGI